MKCDGAPSLALSVLAALVSGSACLPASGDGCIVKDGKAKDMKRPVCDAMVLYPRYDLEED